MRREISFRTGRDERKTHEAGSTGAIGVAWGVLSVMKNQRRKGVSVEIT